MTSKIDKSLLLAVLFFIGFGLVQVYSSSFIYAIENYGDGLYFVRRQMLFSILALVILFSVYKLPWKHLKYIGVLLWVAGLVGLALTLHPGLSIKAGGASRWLQLPFGQRFEPAELIKVTFPFLIAFFLCQKKNPYGSLTWPVRILLVSSAFFIFLKQPDFGSFVLSFLIVFSILFSFGLKWRYMFIGALAAIPLFYALVINVPYRYARVVSYLDPWSDPSHKGFQVIQSMLSFHSGGIFGVGLGQGQGKLFFLPEAHTDFTLAVLGEELGFVGFIFILLIFGFIVYRGLQIALSAQTRFLKAVAVGLTVAFGLSVFTNIGVVLGLLPTKGLTLPFLSYGGSSLVCNAFLMAVLLNIDRQNKINYESNSFTGLKI